MTSSKPLRITAYSVCSAVGEGRQATLQALAERRSGLRPNDFSPSLNTGIGRVPHLEDSPVPSSYELWDCRNNRLAWRGLMADDFLSSARRAIARYGSDRVAIVIGTSTSSIGASEEAYTRLDANGQYPPDMRRPI